MSGSSEVVVLGGELVMPLAPVLLLLDLEDRGFQVNRNSGDIAIRPFSRLTRADRDALNRWKRDVLTLLNYRAPEIA